MYAYASDRGRLNIALLDGETGAQRWADSFDAERAELQPMLDEFANRLARLLQLEIFASNAARAQRLSPQEVTADDLAMQGIALWLRGFSRENVLQANELFERAVTAPPEVAAWLGRDQLHDGTRAEQRLAGRPRGGAASPRRGVGAARAARPGQFLRLAGAGHRRVREEGLAGDAGAGAGVDQVPPARGCLRCLGRGTVLQRPARRGGDGVRARAAHEPARAAAGRVAIPTFDRALHGRAVCAGARLEPDRAAHQPGADWPPIHAAALVELGDRAAAQQALDEFAARHPRMDAAAIVNRLPGTTPRYVAARERLVGRCANWVCAEAHGTKGVIGLSNGAHSGLIGFVAELTHSSALAAHNLTINNLMPVVFDTDQLRVTMHCSECKSKIAAPEPDSQEHPLVAGSAHSPPRSRTVSAALLPVGRRVGVVGRTG